MSLRVKALQEKREPETLSEVRSLLGLANYNSRLIPHFVTPAEPLGKLTRKMFRSTLDSRKKPLESLKQTMAEAGT